MMVVSGRGAKTSALALWIAILMSACSQTEVPTKTMTPSPVATVPAAASTLTLQATSTVSPELAARILDAQGSTTVHDPSMTKDGDMYYIFMTGPGIPMHCSKDMRSWDNCGNVFIANPDWVTQTIPGVENLWAPDVSFHDGKYYVYYAASTFGSNQSAIGLATNATLDSNSPKYNWRDEGLVISSTTSDNYNAIDPNLSYDRGGQPWLAFGSFWSGIKLVKLDPATKKPPAGAELISLADYPASNVDAIEAPFITRRGDFYYLFVSRDICCQGVNSTYIIRVGRSKSIAGPYVDRDGKPMLGGGGTLVYGGSDRWHGPGGQSIYVEGDSYYLVYHSYDAENNGTPTVRIEKLLWDKDNWPVSPSAFVGT